MGPARSAMPSPLILLEGTPNCLTLEIRVRSSSDGLVIGRSSLGEMLEHLWAEVLILSLSSGVERTGLSGAGGAGSTVVDGAGNILIKTKT
eukprot:superscaffoldBa00001419_g10449